MSPSAAIVAGSFTPPSEIPFPAAPAIANPDLVTSWQKGADENEVGQASFYGGGENAYADNPFPKDAPPDGRASHDRFARGPGIPQKFCR